MTYPPSPLGARSDASLAVPGQHAADHTKEREAINAIVAELGTAPQGAYATVQARIGAIEARLSTWGTDPGDVPDVTPAGGYPIRYDGVFPGITPYEHNSPRRQFRTFTRMNLGFHGLYDKSLIIYDAKTLTLRIYNEDNINQYTSIPLPTDAAAAGNPSAWGIAVNGDLTMICWGGVFKRSLAGVWTTLSLRPGVYAGLPTGAHANAQRAQNFYWTANAGDFTNSIVLQRISTVPAEVIAMTGFTGESSVHQFAISGNRAWIATKLTNATTADTWAMRYADIAADGSLSTWTLAGQVESLPHMRLMSSGDGNALLIHAFGLKTVTFLPGGSAPSVTTQQVSTFSAAGVLETRFSFRASTDFQELPPTYVITATNGRNIMTIKSHDKDEDGRPSSSYMHTVVVTRNGFRTIDAAMETEPYRGQLIDASADGFVPNWAAGYGTSEVIYMTNYRLHRYILGVPD